MSPNTRTKWHLALSALINTKRTRPGISMTETIALVIDVPGRVCYLEIFLNQNKATKEDEQLFCLKNCKRVYNSLNPARFKRENCLKILTNDCAYVTLVSK